MLKHFLFFFIFILCIVYFASRAIIFAQRRGEQVKQKVFSRLHLRTFANILNKLRKVTLFQVRQKKNNIYIYIRIYTYTRMYICLYFRIGFHGNVVRLCNGECLSRASGDTPCICTRLRRYGCEPRQLSPYGITINSIIMLAYRDSTFEFLGRKFILIVRCFCSVRIFSSSLLSFFFSLFRITSEK